jgi:hypothetical protein
VTLGLNNFAVKDWEAAEKKYFVLLFFYEIKGVYLQ